MGNSKLITDPKRYDRARAMIRGWKWGDPVAVDEDAMATRILDAVEQQLPGLVGTGLASAVANAAPVIADAVAEEQSKRLGRDA
jgi:hypothetical protein